MSSSKNVNNVYADTAYGPLKRMEWDQANVDRAHMIGTPLSWYKRTQDNANSEEYGCINIIASKNWEEQKAKHVKHEDSVFDVMRVVYDHKSMMPPNYSFISQVFFVAMAFGKLCAYCFPGLYFFFCMIFFSFFIFGDWSWQATLASIFDMGAICISTALVGLFVWKSTRLIERKFPRFFYNMRKAPLWQLNRQTGLFTVYNPKKAWEERVSAPFYEFDAYLVSSPDTQGSSTYSLQLFHSETGVRQPLDAQFPLSNMRGEMIAAWQFIQRYMDVSQPLPDVPALEIHRPNDPRTAEVDERKGRNPRYWRDMSEAEMKRIQEEKYRRNIRQ